MEFLSDLMFGFKVVAEPMNLLLCFVGVFLGTLMGSSRGSGRPVAYPCFFP